MFIFFSTIQIDFKYFIEIVFLLFYNYFNNEFYRVLLSGYMKKDNIECRSKLLCD